MKQIIYKWMSRFDPGCEAVSRFSSHSLDRSLSLKERLSLYLHFIVCGFCRRYHRQLLIIQKLAKSADSDKQDPDVETPRLSPDAKERIKRVLESRSKH